MKKLGKLSINVDKIIKNEQLVKIRGGLSAVSNDCGTDPNSCSGSCKITVQKNGYTISYDGTCKVNNDLGFDICACVQNDDYY